ncbi:monovalent cation/H(+) antiporter subunit G [Novibacillus thermophilus]|uniref:Na+/H+ antiporter subunit G1 n=1 Tax=Novibacillus thermophilus TaxID=1471761 RepID=A0A1U9K610_9BACL|nr:Na+/H+ antiporter subunit G1 [Novibacillus thermophilus]
MLSLIDLIVSGLIVVGVVFTFFGTVGLLRFPDIYTRMHAVTKSSTLGIMCILLGCMTYFMAEHGVVSVKLLLGIVFLFLTAPVGAHMISRAAYRTGVPLWEHSVQDDLADDGKRGPRLTE